MYKCLESTFPISASLTNYYFERNMSESTGGHLYAHVYEAREQGTEGSTNDLVCSICSNDELASLLIWGFHDVIFHNIFLIFRLYKASFGYLC